MSLRVVPLTLKHATAWVDRYHSHHPPPRGGLFAVGVADGERLCCVAIVSRPVARMLAASGPVAEITRVASDRTKHAASKTIAAAARMAIAGGYTRLVSYTLLGESGDSYVAAGWWPTAICHGGTWHTRPGRTVTQTGVKIRWEFGPGALPCDSEEAVEAAIVCALAVGKIKLTRRTKQFSLLDWRAA